MAVSNVFRLARTTAPPILTGQRAVIARGRFWRLSLVLAIAPARNTSPAEGFAEAKKLPPNSILLYSASVALDLSHGPDSESPFSITVPAANRVHYTKADVLIVRMNDSKLAFCASAFRGTAVMADPQPRLPSKHNRKCEGGTQNHGDNFITNYAIKDTVFERDKR